MIFSLVTLDDALGITRVGMRPWNSPSDERWSRNLTAHSAVVMGRRTYESILFTRAPKQILPLFENCMSIVLSHNPMYEAPGATVISSWEKTREIFDRFMPSQRMYVIGGASLYRSTIHDVQGIFMTHIKGDYGCDAKFPFTIEQLRELGFIEARGINLGDKSVLDFPKTYAATVVDPVRTIRLFYRSGIRDQLRASPLDFNIQGS